MPHDHPARDMQDTFWIKEELRIKNTCPPFGRKELRGKEKRSDRPVLRTHTSPVQVRYMEKHNPPIRIIAPGKVFRNEATDSKHEAQFFQIEALYVDKDVSMSHLKGTIEAYIRGILGNDIEVRFRPSYFPFVEPGVEVDVKFRGKWLEMMGAGMVHPNVLKAAGHDPKKWRGFAFGGGLERIIMVKAELADMRILHSGDLRVTEQL
jgi:phenylalanyl-tRNA synthetase alpha chain